MPSIVFPFAITAKVFTRQTATRNNDKGFNASTFLSDWEKIYLFHFLRVSVELRKQL